MIYLLYFSLSFLISFFVTDRVQSFLFLCIFTFLFTSLSFPAGGDWIGYFQHYDCIVNEKCYSDFVFFEPGYEILVKLLGIFGFQTIIVFIGFFNIFFIGLYAKRFDRPALIVLFFSCVFLWSLYIEAIRQSLAISLILLGIIYLRKNEIKKFIFIVFLASFFHVTAFVSLIFTLPYFSIKCSRIFGYGLLAFSFIFIVNPVMILEAFLSVLPQDSMVHAKLQFYLMSDVYKPKISIGLGTILDLFLVFIVLLSFFRVRKNNLINDYRFHTIVFLGVVLYFSFSVFIGRMMPVMTRIGWYGFPFVLMLVYLNIGKSYFYNKNNSNPRKDLVSILIVIFFLAQVFRPLTYNYSRYSILHQETIVENINNLDDLSLRIEADKKCSILTTLGHGYLCNN